MFLTKGFLYREIFFQLICVSTLRLQRPEKRAFESTSDVVGKAAKKSRDFKAAGRNWGNHKLLPSTFIFHLCGMACSSASSSTMSCETFEKLLRAEFLIHFRAKGGKNMKLEFLEMGVGWWMVRECYERCCQGWTFVCFAKLSAAMFLKYFFQNYISFATLTAKPWLVTRHNKSLTL